MAALDDVEFHGLRLADALARFGQASAPLHGGAVRWAWHAVNSYLASALGIHSPAARPTPHFWVKQWADGEATKEVYAWGRRYESLDGTVRELRLMRFGVADDDNRRPAKVAVSAYAVAYGEPAQWPQPWAEPFRVTGNSAARVKRVRVVEIGLEDGSHAVLFDGTPAQARELYAKHAREQVRELVEGGSPRPGASCADCKLVTACDALQRVPGLLGIAGPHAPLRTWSVTNGRQYTICPAQDHLLRLNLPRENEYGPAAVRGQAIHEWLTENHTGPLHAACTVWDVPNPPDDWHSGKWHVTGAQARVGALMLANHADLCPFHHGDQITEVRLEHTFAVHDTAANVVVIAKPDMLYLDDGAWVWRELKTRLRLPQRGPDPYHDYPQLALAVVLMAENALGGKPAGQRVELELLSSRASDIWLIDPSDPAEVNQARAVLHELAAAWHADETYPARPGPHCADCPVRRWCPDADTGATRE
jgi:CRISPR/Cas system-associated exonuclease Cas4 (RecB family)